jgi:uncharacterized protein YecE (DUF72 family)
MKSNLFIGTCSWKYDSWAGLVYSQPNPSSYLEEYSRKFNSVEIDQWFWSLYKPNHVSLPRPEDAERYAESVPDDFRFTIKAPNSLTLTHAYKKHKNDPLISNPHFLSVDLFDRFLESIAPILPKTGALIFQFEYLNKQKMASQMQFLEALNRFAEMVQSPVSISIETRNPQYLNPQFFELLSKHQIAPVFLQGYFMPPIVKTYQTARNYPFAQSVIRLHGPDRQGIEKTTGKIWNEIVASKDEELPEIVEMILDMMEKDISIHLNVNNHYEGSAPLTIEKI